MDNDTSLLTVLRTLSKWKKHILYSTLGIILLSIIISLSLPNYYKAATLFYSANPQLAYPSPVGDEDEAINVYGGDHELDRLFSLANSDNVVSYLIDTFDLYNHYDIDPDNKKAPFKVRERLFKLYKSTKTKYDALHLSVEDKDPVLAAQMANAAREKISKVSQQMIKESHRKILKNYENGIKKKEIAIEKMNDTLAVQRKLFKIYDSNTQGEVFAGIFTETEAYINEKKAKREAYEGIRDSVRRYDAQIAGAERKLDSLNKDIAKFNSGIYVIKKLEIEIINASQQLSNDKQRYNQLKSSYEAPFTAIHVVEEASTPVVKSRPKRSIIVMGAAIFGFVLSVLGVLMIDSYKKVNWKDILKGE